MALGKRSLLGGVVIFFAALISADVDPVVIKGYHFFYKSNGSEFFLRGVSYQPSSKSTPIDPLSVSLNCMRDIQFLAALHTNVIRVSYIDSRSDHSACMSALQTAGIYVLVDLPQSALVNNSNPEWTLDMYNSWTATVDIMAGYNNTLGFFAGNNVVTNITTSPAAAYVKAAVRDMKAYIAQKGYRKIPVGYEMSASNNYDVASLYMTCTGNGSTDSIDFLGISDFNWCSNNTYVNSGYENIVNQYGSYAIPIFFSEYGCKDVSTVARLFEDVSYIYGTQMTNVLSGGIVKEYFQDDDNMGLVTVSGTSISALPDYTSYSSQIAKITPSSTYAGNYTISNTITQSCPTAAFSASPTLPPGVNANICSCMMSSLRCRAPPGINPATAESTFMSLCGSKGPDCLAVVGDGSTGKYGAYSMCNITERLSWVYDRQNSFGSCARTPDAISQNYTTRSSDCVAVEQQVGYGDSTGTITSTPAFTATPSSDMGMVSNVHYYYGSNLSNGTIAGIVVGSLLIIGLVASGIAWFCCIRKRRRAAQKDMSSQHDDIPESSTHSPEPSSPGILRGGGESIISLDSRADSELPRFDGSYMGNSSTQWSRTELQSVRSDVPAGYASVSERDAAIYEMHTPISRRESPTFLVPASPMGSDKELPAFRRGMEDKSLASMKLLVPSVKISPV